MESEHLKTDVEKFTELSSIGGKLLAALTEVDKASAHVEALKARWFELLAELGLKPSMPTPKAAVQDERVAFLKSEGFTPTPKAAVQDECGLDAIMERILTFVQTKGPADYSIIKEEGLPDCTQGGVRLALMRLEDAGKIDSTGNSPASLYAIKKGLNFDDFSTQEIMDKILAFLQGHSPSPYGAVAGLFPHSAKKPEVLKSVFEELLAKGLIQKDLFNAYSVSKTDKTKVKFVFGPNYALTDFDGRILASIQKGGPHGPFDFGKEFPNESHGDIMFSLMRLNKAGLIKVVGKEPALLYCLNGSADPQDVTCQKVKAHVLDFLTNRGAAATRDDLRKACPRHYDSEVRLALEALMREHKVGYDSEVSLYFAVKKPEVTTQILKDQILTLLKEAGVPVHWNSIQQALPARAQDLNDALGGLISINPNVKRGPNNTYYYWEDMETDRLAKIYAAEGSGNVQERLVVLAPATADVPLPERILAFLEGAGHPVNKEALWARFWTIQGSPEFNAALATLIKENKIIRSAHDELSIPEEIPTPAETPPVSVKELTKPLLKRIVAFIRDAGVPVNRESLWREFYGDFGHQGSQDFNMVLAYLVQEKRIQRDTNDDFSVCPKAPVPVDAPTPSVAAPDELESRILAFLKEVGHSVSYDEIRSKFQCSSRTHYLGRMEISLTVKRLFTEGKIEQDTEGKYTLHQDKTPLPEQLLGFIKEADKPIDGKAIRKWFLECSYYEFQDALESLVNDGKVQKNTLDEYSWKTPEEPAVVVQKTKGNSPKFPTKGTLDSQIVAYLDGLKRPASAKEIQDHFSNEYKGVSPRLSVLAKQDKIKRLAPGLYASLTTEPATPEVPNPATPEISESKGRGQHSIKNPRKGSQSQQTLDYLAKVGRPVALKELTSAVPGFRPSTTYLTELVRAGKVERISKALYCLKGVITTSVPPTVDPTPAVTTPEDVPLAPVVESPVGTPNTELPVADQVYNYIACLGGGFTSTEVKEAFAKLPTCFPSESISLTLATLNKGGRIYKYDKKYYVMPTLESGKALSLSEKVFQLISDVGVEVTPEKVARALQAVRHSCVNALSSLQANGKIQRTGKGTYASIDYKKPCPPTDSVPA